MKAMNKFSAAFFAMVLLAVSGYAQERPAHRAAVNNSRQDAKVERQQNQVDKKQKPTNIENQGATDKKVRDARGNDRNGFGNGRPDFQGERPSGNRPSGDRPSGDRPSGRPDGNFGNRPDGNFGGGDRPSMPPSGGNGRPDFDGKRPDGHFGDGNRPPMPPEGFRGHAKRPEMAPVIDYTRNQIYERTNASSLLINTTFRTKEEAYDYIWWLLEQKSYVVGSYGNNCSWIMSEVAFIPTPFDWTNPMTHNQFRMKFHIARSGADIKVTLTGEWRESYLIDNYTKLRFQPSNRYSTYYAWNVMEDFANNIPHRYITYKR